VDQSAAPLFSYWFPSLNWHETALTFARAFLIILESLFHALKFFARSQQDFLLNLEFFAGDKVQPVEGVFQHASELAFQVGAGGFEFARHGFGEASGDVIDGLKVWAHL